MSKIIYWNFAVSTLSPETFFDNEFASFCVDHRIFKSQPVIYFYYHFNSCYGLKKNVIRRLDAIAYFFHCLRQHCRKLLSLASARGFYWDTISLLSNLIWRNERSDTSGRGRWTKCWLLQVLVVLPKEAPKQTWHYQKHDEEHDTLSGCYSFFDSTSLVWFGVAFLASQYRFNK